MNKKLYRDEHQKVIGGVCAGLAQYFDMDVTIVRLLFAFTFFVMGAGLGTYIILWIVLPRKGYPYNSYINNPTVDYTVPPQPQSNQFEQPQGGNPFGSNPFGSNTYGGNPYGGNQMASVPQRQKSNAGVIFGMVLIFIGGAILIDEYDLIPDFDFFRLWPIGLLIVGGALIASGQKSQPWHHSDWKKEAKSVPEPESDEPTTV